MIIRMMTKLKEIMIGLSVFAYNTLKQFLYLSSVCQVSVVSVVNLFHMDKPV